MSSWLSTALFALLMTGATVLVLAILVGLWRDRAKVTRRYNPALARFPAVLSSRSERAYSRAEFLMRSRHLGKRIKCRLGF